MDSENVAGGFIPDSFTKPTGIRFEGTVYGSGFSLYVRISHRLDWMDLQNSSPHSIHQQKTGATSCVQFWQQPQIKRKKMTKNMRGSTEHTQHNVICLWRCKSQRFSVEVFMVGYQKIHGVDTRYRHFFFLLLIKTNNIRSCVFQFSGLYENYDTFFYHFVYKWKRAQIQTVWQGVVGKSVILIFSFLIGVIRFDGHTCRVMVNLCWSVILGRLNQQKMFHIGLTIIFQNTNTKAMSIVNLCSLWGIGIWNSGAILCKKNHRNRFPKDVPLSLSIKCIIIA